MDDDNDDNNNNNNISVVDKLFVSNSTKSMKNCWKGKYH
jgi:hypothetical protein